MLESLYLILILYKEVDIVQAVHQAMFLISVDFEMLALSCRLIGYSLFWQIHFHLCLRVGIDRIEQFFQERLAHHYRKHEVIKLIVFMDIGKEARYHYSKAISGDSPSRMFTTGTTTEVLSGYQYLAAVSRVVQYELFVYSSVGVL